MNDIIYDITRILWIFVMIELGIAILLIYRRYTKDKTKYILGITIFFILFLLSRIASYINYYIYDYRGELYLIDEPIWLFYQILYNTFSYGGGFILYFVIERYIIKSKYIFSASTIVGCIIAIINYIVPADLTTINTPFYLIVLFGYPILYFYLAIKSSGRIRTNSLLLAFGIMIFEFGMAFAIAEAQSLVWEKFMDPTIYLLGGPILHMVGTIILLLGFLRGSTSSAKD